MLVISFDVNPSDYPLIDMMDEVWSEKVEHIFKQRFGDDCMVIVTPVEYGRVDNVLYACDGGKTVPFKLLAVITSMFAEILENGVDN